MSGRRLVFLPDSGPASRSPRLPSTTRPSYGKPHRSADGGGHSGTHWISSEDVEDVPCRGATRPSEADHGPCRDGRTRLKAGEPRASRGLCFTQTVVLLPAPPWDQTPEQRGVESPVVVLILSLPVRPSLTLGTLVATWASLSMWAMLTFGPIGALAAIGTMGAMGSVRAVGSMPSLWALATMRTVLAMGHLVWPVVWPAVLTRRHSGILRSLRCQDA